MIKHSTNYINTFIKIAEDCPEKEGTMPPLRTHNKTIANYQFEMLYGHPYEYTSDEIIFSVYATRNNISNEDLENERDKFFSKGQACFRSSPLTKRYGWGIHNDETGKIAMYGAETDEYKKFLGDATVKKVNAMRSKRK